MNITVESRELTKELEILTKVTSPKPGVLANVLVQTREAGLVLVGTDLEIGIVTFCPAVVNQEGATTLPAKRLLDIVKRLGNNNVTLAAEEKGSVTITSGRYSGRLPTYEATTYPTVPNMKGLERTPLSGDFHRMIRQTRFAVTDKSTRYFMNGALFTGAAMVATDGYRMSVSKGDVLELEQPVIIPSKALDKLDELYTSDAIFASTDRHLFFAIDGRLVFSRVIDGKFPSWEKIIPTKQTHKAKISAELVRDAVQRVTITSEDIILQFSEDLLTISSRSADLGDASEQVDVEYGDKLSKIILNGRYLLDFLTTVEGQLEMSWRDGGSVMFKAGETYTYVQMPMAAS